MGAVAANPRTLTRQDLIALGRAGRPRDFLPLAVRGLEQSPGDVGLRFLVAANLAGLGLRTLALENLGELPAEAGHDPDVIALRGAVERLADDRIDPDARIETARANLDVVRERGLGGVEALEGAWEDWRARQAGEEWFRTADGNVVRRGTGRGHWAGQLLDQRAVAERFCTERFEGLGPFPPALAIEGADPPWLFETAWRRLGENRVGYAPPLTLLQADSAECLDGLALADLREALADERVRVFVGAGASLRWLEDALGRLGEAAIGTAAAVPGVRTRLVPDAQTVSNRWSAALHAEAQRLRAGIEGVYGERDLAWWSARFGAAAAGKQPLRVLIPTSRYSTYIRHASEDLADSFRALGCEAEVAMEASDRSRPTTVGHLRWIDSFEPDLVVLINYFRGDAGLPFPAQVPWVCWIQDTMGHQFAERRFGELDFVAGHVHAELRRREGFPRERALPFPVVASTRKFHPGPVDAAAGERLACEVAYVSHQSETPQAFHARCLAEERDAGAGRLLEALRPRVEREALEPMGASLHGRLAALTREVTESTLGGDPGRAGYLLRHYALPLADRVVRHQMLGWAAEICRRRGWRMRIFGRGWEEHPGLASLACGEIEHGEALRACYQSAAVHLHASVNTLVHQRVMECALSGGLPVGRLTSDIVQDCLGSAKREAVLTCEPVAGDAETGDLRYVVADCPPLREAGTLREWLGLASPDVQTITAAQAESFRRPDHPGAGGMHAAWLFGDLRALTARSEADLEGVLERAVEDRAWRAERSSEIAARVRERCSTDAFAARVLELVRRGLGAAPARAGAAEAAA